MTAMDDDAPQVAGAAAQALTVLSDATCASVQYPGLHGLPDAEAVLAALTRLADDLGDTAAHLDRYLLAQLDDQQVLAVDRFRSTASAVQAARGTLEQVRDAAAHLSALLTQAELAMLALTPAAPE